MGTHVSSLAAGQVVSNHCVLSNYWHDECGVLCPHGLWKHQAPPLTVSTGKGRRAPKPKRLL